MDKNKSVEPLNLEGEIWEPVVGFEGLYEVSNFGRIRSIGGGKGRHKDTIIMKQRNQRGYMRINLHKDDVSYYFWVHRLVYEAFCGIIPKFKNKGKGHGSEMFEINHIDENPSNNKLDNLELVTRTQNNNHGTRTHRMAKTLCKQVYQYTKEFELVKIWEGTRQCKSLGGYVQGAVASCCRGDRKSHRGFIWSYVPLKKQG